MTLFDIRKSGLAVPHERTRHSAPKYGSLELQDEDARQLAKDAMSLLWDAMDLSRPPGILVPGKTRAAFDAHRKAYRYIGEVLLGNECPEKEVLT